MDERWTEPRHTRLWGTVSRVLVPLTVFLAVGIVFVPTLFLGWGTVYHWVCDSSGPEGLEPNLWVPVAISNAPYGGNATVMTYFSHPSDYDGYGFGNGGPTNSSAVITEALQIAFNVTFLSETRELAWGPGTVAQCPTGFVAELQNPSGAGASSPQVNVSSLFSDQAVANSVPANDANGPPPLFNASFTEANSHPISTCDEPATSYRVAVDRFDLTFQWIRGNTTTLVNFVVTYPTVYVYNFPGHFGTWQVDNLSMPGGPGGGWAFSYSPCP